LYIPQLNNHQKVKLAARALQQLQHHQAQIQKGETATQRPSFVHPDVEKIGAVVKDMNITAHAEGMALHIESMETKGDECDRLFNLAMRRFEAASTSTLDNRFTVKSWGDALAEQAKRKTGEAREK
jgi:hypothetical protein